MLFCCSLPLAPFKSYLSSISFHLWKMVSLLLALYFHFLRYMLMIKLFFFRETLSMFLKTFEPFHNLNQTDFSPGSYLQKVNAYRCRQRPPKRLCNYFRVNMKTRMWEIWLEEQRTGREGGGCCLRDPMPLGRRKEADSLGYCSPSCNHLFTTFMVFVKRPTPAAQLFT